MSGELNRDRRRLIAAGVVGIAGLALPGGSLVAQQAVQMDELAWLPAWRIREMVAARSLSPVEITRFFLDRIDRLDPALGSLAQVDGENAMRAAQEAEKAAMRGDNLGPLHGVPVTLKQMIAVRGLVLENGEIASADSAVAERLRRAGGIILGTTTLAGPADMLGEARAGAANPWDTARVAGASSSGSAAAVAAGFCPLSIGSDGGGSTRLPAAWCGVVGLHPTTGRVPADHDVLRGMSRTSWSGSYGPITRDVRDAATALSVMAGPHWRHTHSFNGPAPDYLDGLDGGVRDMRIAWARDLGGRVSQRDVSSPVLDSVSQSARKFSTLGAEVEEVELDLGDWYPVFTRIVAEYSTGPAYPMIASVARSWNSVRGKPASPLWSGELEDALAARQAMAEKLQALFNDYDVLATATSPVIAPTRRNYEEWLALDSHSPEYTSLTGHMNLLGFPAISIPAGLVQGMPVGLQLVARPDADAMLLRVAHAYVRRFGAGHPEFG